MESRVLGRTRERVPVIGMGTWAMGNSTGEKHKQEIEALEKGIELGMRLIDTAESYGRGKSEALVGRAIRDVRDQVFLASKVSPEHFGYDEVLRSCEASLERLEVKYIDLYQLHWPNPRVPIQETMRAMEELVSRGKIRYIGVSNFSVEETIKAQEALPRSEVVSNQVRYSPRSRHIEGELLPFCEKERITIIAYSPFETGDIHSDGVPKELLTRYDMTAAQVILNWVTYRDNVIAIPKASNIAHVEENANSLDIRLSERDYQMLSKTFESSSP
jgi:diketogulonate reductase-like aldo/keto reductase